MEQKFRKISWEIFKSFGVIAGFIMILAMYPASKGTLTNSNYFVVNDEETASQTLTDCSDGPILVEFKCEAKDFPKLLNTFVINHEEFDFKIVKSIYEDPDCAKEFIVAFTNNH